MSHITYVTEKLQEVDNEEFNDDTDLPLPLLPHTGSHGPLLQE